MNASELAIYAPLWTAVPETRPTDGERDLICDGGRVGWATYDGRGGYYIHDRDQVPGFITAALCRVAAEDWLLRKFRRGGVFNPSVTIQIDCHDAAGQWPAAFSVRIDHSPGDEDAERVGHGEGPTIHHALVAACLAIHASASPSPAPPS